MIGEFCDAADELQAFVHSLYTQRIVLPDTNRLLAGQEQVFALSCCGIMRA